jgi:hypothetical protein
MRLGIIAKRAMKSLTIVGLLAVLVGSTAFADEDTICGKFQVAGVCTPKDTINDQRRCAFEIGGRDIQRIFMSLAAYDQIRKIMLDNPEANVCAVLENGKIVAFRLIAD